jgi:hypothetical protein
MAHASQDVVARSDLQGANFSVQLWKIILFHNDNDQRMRLPFANVSRTSELAKLPGPAWTWKITQPSPHFPSATYCYWALSRLSALV